LTAPNATLTTPPRDIDTFQAPFLQLRWKVENLGRAQPFIDWSTKSAADFTPERRMYFDPPESGKIAYSQVPVYRHPQWTGEIARLRIGFGNPQAWRPDHGASLLHYIRHPPQHQFTELHPRLRDLLPVDARP